MRKNKFILTTGALTVAVALLSGCASWDQRSADRSPGRMADDKAISSKVKKELASEPVYKFNDVEVQTFNGVVQLSGFVKTDEQKQRAGELAENIRGVHRVVNNITLKDDLLTPTGRPSGTHQQQEREYKDKDAAEQERKNQ